jgi:hypothetical protein
MHMAQNDCLFGFFYVSILPSKNRVDKFEPDRARPIFLSRIHPDNYISPWHWQKYDTMPIPAPPRSQVLAIAPSRGHAKLAEELQPFEDLH